MMTLRAPTGTKAELMQWLKGLQDEGCVRVVDVVGVSPPQETAGPGHYWKQAGEPVEARLRLIDPRRSNVFLAGEGGAAEA